MEGHSTRVYRGSGRSLGTCGSGLHCIMHRTRNRASLGCTSRPYRLGVPSQAPLLCEVVQSSEETGAGLCSQ